MKKIKIKGSVQKLTPKAPMLAAFIGILILLPLRIWQLAANTDLTTGFFIERDAFVYIFFIVAVLTSLAVIVLSFLSSKMPGNKLAEEKRPVLGAASVLLAAGFGFESLQQLTALRDAAGMTGLSLYEASVANESLRDLIECTSGLVAAVAFVTLAVACFSGKYTWLKIPAVLFLGAPLWGIMRVISCFTYTISYLVLAELFCNMYAAIGLMLFLFCLARYFTQTGSEGGTWTVLASGLFSAVFCLLASVPRIVSSILGLGTVEGLGIDLIFVAGAVFSVVAVLSVINKGIEENEEEVQDKEDGNETADNDGEIPVAPFTVE